MRSNKRLIEHARREFDRTADVEILLADELAEAVAESDPRGDLTRSIAVPVVADRPRARAGAWYEMVPRSQGTVPGKHGTFDDCIARLPEIAALGFDVVYLPPIHPIGMTNRKGRNNALQGRSRTIPAVPTPSAAGRAATTRCIPSLARSTTSAASSTPAAALDMEVALDFAIQCSPDHPWLKQHPEWFKRRPDGSIRYAENPPKKYEDIVNPDFYCADRIALWQALRDVILFWVQQGVRIFRVDNPHTKPFPFWEWLIHEVQERDPNVLFLSEAFSRPKIMKGLAKLGFSQSYTYFTWRTHKAELQEYLSEITALSRARIFPAEFFRQHARHPAGASAKGRAVDVQVARCARGHAVGNYGIYNGFELLEHEPIPGREEYLNSEKYEIKVRDWDKPGNIKSYIGRLNRLRRENPALQQTSNLRFAQVDDGEVIGFVKESVGARQRRRGRDRVERSRPAHILVPFRRDRDRPRRQARAGARHRQSGHRRAAHHRMGRRAADASIRPTIRPCFSAAKLDAMLP